MRYVGIDYGHKKVGVAISNETHTMAFPHVVLKNTTTLRGEILALIHTHHAKVVLGDSRANDGRENPIATDIRALGEWLAGQGIVVYYEPEHYSSKEAERIQGRTAMTDASAAAILLSSFLTRNHTE
jgi:putative holliday junction resolvase